MRISELSTVTGVPVARIKYYIREGLLPRGERTAEHQALYSPEHERRLRLIRALITVGGVSVVDARAILDAMDAEPWQVDKTVGLAMYALPQPRRDADDSLRHAGTDQLDALIERHGWTIDPRHPARAAAVDALAVLAEFGFDDCASLLDRYAEAADIAAQADLAEVKRDGDVRDVVEGSVAGTVAGESLLAAMRRLAHAHGAACRQGQGPGA